ncbi:MAG: ATP-binding protein [Dermatophilaceae bacterium]
MSDALFSALDVEVPTESRPGYRLEALELLNWGTFDNRVEVLRLGGENTLVTGDIGSGKSTLVDAVTTLLLPANRINYNKAAGAETRERSLRTYVLGHYKSERVESTGASRAVGLRDHSSYSVLLGRFRNEGFDADVTLAQVFWLPGSGEQQPRRFFVTHDQALSISEHFTEFGRDPADLKRRLRGLGATVSDHFPEYGTRLRRLLGIRSEQALDLFHQTISMKSVGNLTEFVRQHMLEPADTGPRIAQLVQHFEDLTRAHDAVRKARDQLAQLDPIVTAADEHDWLGAEIAESTEAREALPAWVAERRLELLDVELQRITEARDATVRLVEESEQGAAALERTLGGLRQRRDGIAGPRLAEIAVELDASATQRDERRVRARAHADLVTTAGLAQVEDRASFSSVRSQVLARHAEIEQRRVADTDEITERTVALRDVQARSDELQTEIRSLQGRESNIERRQVELRNRLAGALGVESSTLPFVGELIQVREGEGRWRGAAERVLRGFALSVLVPADRYAQVASWVDGHHLRGRFVYFRVGDAVVRRSSPLREEPTLADVLEVRPGPYAEWLESELEVRADHVRVEDAEELARHRRAVTLQGQVKADRRHEKDDRFAIDDPARWVLGWSNAEKVKALLDAAATVTVELDDAKRLVAEAKSAASRRAALDQAIVQLLAYADWEQLDWASSASRIAALEAERRQLEEDNAELAEVEQHITAVESDLVRAKRRHQDATEDLGGLKGELARLSADHTRTSGRLADFAAADLDRLRTAYGVLAGRTIEPASIDDCDRVEREVRDELTGTIEGSQRRQATVGERVVRLIGGFRQSWPSDTVELGADVEAASEYRELRARIASDDLPRFEAEFKRQLNTNTINDIAGFQAWLDQSAQTIRSRIREIDESLGAIDYNPGTRISLLAEPTPHQEIRSFRDELRACTDDALSSDDQYSEERFRKVKAIIERFRGREGLTEADRRWTTLVTDVRNWYVFAASERDRETREEREHYTDSDGKSGGQKEKLAYTILAASLAYQFGLTWGVPTSRDFRFTVIDEAFGRGSDASTRYALELFRKLGLQLLIVTPLQKVHVIEPFVSAVGFVENRTGQRSRLQTLTIEDYRAERELRVREAEVATV